MPASPARHLDPVLETRLRFVRRLVEAVIIVVGVAIALSQFTALDRFAASILASTAPSPRRSSASPRGRSLANVIAGVMLAVTQPIRIGDLVTLEGDTGVVEDIRLTYTFLRTGDDARVIVPNEQARRRASCATTRSSPTRSRVEVELWLPHEVDERRALEVDRRARRGRASRRSAR